MKKSIPFTPFSFAEKQSAIFADIKLDGCLFMVDYCLKDPLLITVKEKTTLDKIMDLLAYTYLTNKMETHSFEELIIEQIIIDYSKNRLPKIEILIGS